MDNNEKIEKLCSDLARLEFTPEMHIDKIKEQIDKGVDKFELYESSLDGVALDMKLNISYYDKSDRYVLTDTEALLIKDIPVPPATTDDISAEDLEKAIIEFKQIDLGTADHTSVELQKLYIDQHLENYMEHSPDTFCAIIAKHDPDFPYEISPEHEVKINQLKEGQEVYANFSSYFNLTPDNMRNLLQNPDVAVRKQFFAKQKPEDDPLAKRETYHSWVRPIVGETADNGTTKMKMFKDYELHAKLGGLNFVETQDRARLNEVVKHLQDGYEVVLNNRNKESEIAKVRIIANPEMRTVAIYPETGPRIPKSHKQFLKDPVRATLGENGIELHRQSEMNRNQKVNPNTTQQQQPNRLAGRQRILGNPKANGLGF